MDAIENEISRTESESHVNGNSFEINSKFESTFEKRN